MLAKHSYYVFLHLFTTGTLVRYCIPYSTDTCLLGLGLELFAVKPGH